MDENSIQKVINFFLFLAKHCPSFESQSQRLLKAFWFQVLGQFMGRIVAIRNVEEEMIKNLLTC